MTQRPRRNRTPVFKSKVALAAVRGRQPLGELAQPFDVHPNQIKQWRDQLVAGAGDIFGQEKKPSATDTAIDVKTRHAKALGISRGSAYYKPRPVSDADLALMRRIDDLHLDYPFAGSQMLQGLLLGEGY